MGYIVLIRGRRGFCGIPTRSAGRYLLTANKRPVSHVNGIKILEELGEGVGKRSVQGNKEAGSGHTSKYRKKE